MTRDSRAAIPAPTPGALAPTTAAPLVSELDFPASRGVPFANVDPSQVITGVSGLPRSGTSLMMQLLAAAGRTALTDGKRGADADNPLGYYEFAQVLDLPPDISWIPQARGKVVKIVAQLLPYLPRNAPCSSATAAAARIFIPCQREILLRR